MTIKEKHDKIKVFLIHNNMVKEYDKYNKILAQASNSSNENLELHNKLDKIIELLKIEVE